MRSRTNIWPVAASLSLSVIAAGCAGTEGEFPTLAKRNVETYYETGGDSGAGETPAPPPASNSLTEKLDGLLAQAKAGQTDFETALPLARSRADDARGAQPGGESWSQATTAISALDTSRSESATALADLDQLYADTLTAEELNPADADAIRRVHAQVYEMVEAQTRQVEALTASVGG